MKRRIDPVHVAEVLRRERALERELFHPTEEQRREAAHRLGLAHHLPDPQQALPLEQRG